MGLDRDSSRSYVPALGIHFLTRFYDPIVRITLREDRFRRLLIEQARVEPGQRVLDLGCGTGTLTILLKQACPDASVAGLDGDFQTLEIARRKIAAAGLSIDLQRAMTFAPPYAPRSFDRVLSSLVFHHLTTANKRRTFAAVRELLRPGGELHVADWGKPQNALMQLAFLGVRLLDGFETTRDNAEGRLVELIQEAGFRSVAETHHEMTVFGTLSLYRAIAPERS